MASTISMFSDREVLAEKPNPLADTTGVPHSLEEKLAMVDRARDDIARRSRASILTVRFSRPVGARDGRKVLVLDTGIGRSWWMCSSDSRQESGATMYEEITPTREEREAWDRA